MAIREFEAQSIYEQILRAISGVEPAREKNFRDEVRHTYDRTMKYREEKNNGFLRRRGFVKKETIESFDDWVDGVKRIEDSWWNPWPGYVNAYETVKFNLQKLAQLARANVNAGTMVRLTEEDYNLILVYESYAP